MEDQSREAEIRPPILDGQLHLLLGDLKDEASGYRRREATWMSLAFHAVIVLALLFMPKWMPKSALIVPRSENDTPIFLSEKKTPSVTPPKSNAISDQDRVAQTRAPKLKAPPPKFLDERTPGPPKPMTPPPQPAGGQQAMQAPPSAQPATSAPPPPRTTETAKLEAPQPKQNPFKISPAGSAVDRAIRSAANNGPTAAQETFGGGEMGSRIRAQTDHRGALEILSDTKGVDFGPYLKRLKYVVQNHWDPLIPEVARPPIMKRGMLVVEFYIMKDGSIKGMRLIKGSGDRSLDEAAWGALEYSVPLEKLPIQFTGDYLLLRAAFYYNPDTKEFE
jgi:outer membrane biosynthesis protein TonB